MRSERCEPIAPLFVYALSYRPPVCPPSILNLSKDGGWFRQKFKAELLKCFPFFAGDVCLFQESGKEFDANIRLMRVWNSKRDVVADHELVFAPGIGAVKTCLPQVCRKISAFDRSKRRHYATRVILRFRSSTVGRERLRDTRKRIHSSRTSANSSRHSSKDFACEYTP